MTAPALPHTLACALALTCLAAAAQQMPQGPAPRNHGSSIIRESTVDPATAARRAETMRPHVLTLFAAGLDKESAALALSPAAASAMQAWMRDMKDFAGLEDRRTQQRMGWTLGAVHATVDVTRDLNLMSESAHELDGAASDVAGGWKKVMPLLDEGQRRRVEAIYGSALIESRRTAPARN